MEKTAKTREATSIETLIKLIETLRGKNGCPWDRKQTPRSMAIYLVEELYELVDAIESGRPEDVCEELGDVLFHIFFIARLFEETGHFKIDDVAAVTTDKMTRRHPHVFGIKSVDTEEEVKKQWHALKTKEKKPVKGDSLLDSLPSKLPALMRAYRISERVAKAGFDWNDIGGVFEKVEEEWAELGAAIRADEDGMKNRNVSLEFGDLLFTLVNVARFARIHPETALKDAMAKFEKRFRYMERILWDTGKTMDALSERELDQIWETAKEKTDH